MRQGSSLFELVVAIGVVGLILLTLVSLSTLSVRNSAFAQNESEAARLGQETIEWLRGERDKNWSAFVGQVTISPKRCVKAPSWNSSPTGPCRSTDVISVIFTREVDFTTVDTNGDTFVDRVEAVVSVSWLDGQGSHTIKNSTYYTDWRLR